MALPGAALGRRAVAAAPLPPRARRGLERVQRGGGERGVERVVVFVERDAAWSEQLLVALDVRRRVLAARKSGSRKHAAVEREVRPDAADAVLVERARACARSPRRASSPHTLSFEIIGS